MFKKKKKYLYAITYKYYKERQTKIIPARDEIKAVKIFNSLFVNEFYNISMVRITKIDFAKGVETFE